MNHVICRRCDQEMRHEYPVGVDRFTFDEHESRDDCISALRRALLERARMESELVQFVREIEAQVGEIRAHRLGGGAPT